MREPFLLPISQVYMLKTLDHLGLVQLKSGTDDHLFMQNMYVDLCSFFFHSAACFVTIMGGLLVFFYKGWDIMKCPLNFI